MEICWIGAPAHDDSPWHAGLEYWVRRLILLNQAEPADFAVAFVRDRQSRKAGDNDVGLGESFFLANNHFQRFFKPFEDNGAGVFKWAETESHVVRAGLDTESKLHIFAKSAAVAVEFRANPLAIFVGHSGFIESVAPVLIPDISRLYRRIWEPDSFEEVFVYAVRYPEVIQVLPALNGALTAFLQLNLPDVIVGKQLLPACAGVHVADINRIRRYL